MLSIFRRRYLPRRPWSSSTSWPSVISPMLNVFTRSDRYSVGWLVQIMNGVSSIVVPSLLNICMILAPWWWMLWMTRTPGPLLPRSTSLLTHAEHSWALALSALKQEWIFCSKNCWRRIFLLLITEETSYSPCLKLTTESGLSSSPDLSTRNSAILVARKLFPLLAGPTITALRRSVTRAVQAWIQDGKFCQKI